MFTSPVHEKILHNQHHFRQKLEHKTGTNQHFFVCVWGDVRGNTQLRSSCSILGQPISGQPNLNSVTWSFPTVNESNVILGVFSLKPTPHICRKIVLHYSNFVNLSQIGHSQHGDNKIWFQKINEFCCMLFCKYFLVVHLLQHGPDLHITFHAQILGSYHSCLGAGLNSGTWRSERKSTTWSFASSSRASRASSTLSEVSTHNLGPETKSSKQQASPVEK